VDLGLNFFLSHVAEMVEPELLSRPEVGLELFDLRRRERHMEHPRLLEVAIDTRRMEEGSKLRGVVVAEAREAHRLVAAKMGDGKGVGVVDRLSQDPRIAATRSVGSPFLLQDCDLEARLEVLEVMRGPQAGEARANDDDVSLALTLQGWLRSPRPEGEPVARFFDGSPFHDRHFLRAELSARNRIIPTAGS